jgi:protein-S-isoprenylcysteine O-methyltransferase Ste14
MRLWLWLPDWAFSAVGALLFFAYAFARMGDYRDFPRVGPWWASPIGEDAFGFVQYGPRHYFPVAKILSDLTFLLIGLSFCVRVPPRRRAHTARQIIVPLIGGFWPFLPFMVLAVLEIIDGPWQVQLDGMLGFGQIGIERFYLAMLAISAGNLLDVWGYSVLLPSFSIVAEARELKVKGPYRFVRHPLYLGQLVAQGAFWLVLLPLRWIWVVFFAAFVVMQLYRARVEEGVLEEVFGETYRIYKRRTFWFV